ncbi:dephospho-CoA kinase [Halomonas halocynthiae]|uniref:dephospho-CoA kinase n=1 Tax=Halomonas halocynthiae TaxID=176290 RepID=UPI00041BB559|nr:dephospho-CoA kinase [Halomonas halocynthiae]
MTQNTPIIGVTGGIASGKSTVARSFERYNIPWVDADDVAREVVAPGSPALAAIVKRYGSNMLDAQGMLKRSALRNVVFADVHERQWLESVTHPQIRQRLTKQLNAFRCSQAPYALLVSPLLLESGQVDLVDRILVIDVPEAMQVARTVQRDGVNEAGARAILAAQMSREQRLEKADEVLDNSRDQESLDAQIDMLNLKYRQLDCLPNKHR